MVISNFCINSCNLLDGNIDSVQIYIAPILIKYVWKKIFKKNAYNLIKNSIYKIPAARPPSVLGNWTVKHNCKANCVFPVLAVP